MERNLESRLSKARIEQANKLQEYLYGMRIIKSCNMKEYIKNHIKEFLPLEYQDADVIVKPVVKNNDQVLTGLTILKDEGQYSRGLLTSP